MNNLHTERNTSFKQMSTWRRRDETFEQTSDQIESNSNV